MRVLLIDQDRTAAQKLGLDCVARGVAVVFAEDVREGVRALLESPISLIVVDAGALRLTPREHAELFQRVAPGVPVMAAFAAQAPLEARVAYEVLGVTTVTKPVSAEDILDKNAVLTLG